MTIAITWSINQLDCKSQLGSMTDYVVTAHWLINGTDGTYNASGYGAVNFKEVVDKPDYKPFNKLTSDEVISWVKNALGAEKIAKIEASIATQISYQAAPRIITPPLPWNTQ